MKGISSFPRDAARSLLGVFFDIDDTFTTSGKIPLVSFSALWELSLHNIHAVPITGRPAGWCDHIARMWPVTGIVGENGAFYFNYDVSWKKLNRRFFFSPDEAGRTRKKLLDIGEEILKAIPGTAFASDQAYRLFDIAIDFTEDVPSLSRDDVKKICDIFASHGVHHKVSSIHVNGWFGDYDKLTMTKIFSREVLGLDLDAHKDRFVFLGDSPNDEPMFRFFPHAIGVANIKDFSDILAWLPNYITEKRSGEGFAEAITKILALRT